MKAKYILKLVIIYISLIVSQIYGANLRLEVEGISNDLQRNIIARLSSISSDDSTTIAYLKNRIDSEIREGLRALGYYSPTISFLFNKAKNNNNNVLIIRVMPGKPIKVSRFNVVLHGDSQQDNDYQKWVTDTKITVLDSILNHGTYDNFKSGLSSLALHKGYFDAEFRHSQLDVIPSRYQAHWNIDFDSGQRYRFGRTHFYGSQIRKDYLQNLIKTNEGDYYSSELLANINRKLMATNWFSSIVIAPDLSAASKHSKIMPLNIVLTPSSSNNLETGIGYTTDIGPRIKATWNKPWLSLKGHSLQSNISISSSEQSSDFSYKIPLLQDPLEQYYIFQGSFRRININNTQTDSTAVNIARYWNLSAGWRQVINLRWSLDHFTQDNITDTTMLIYPGISINRSRQRGGFLPIWGDNQRYSLDISNSYLGSNIEFIILQAQNVWIRTLIDGFRIVSRANLGWIETKDFKRIPPSIRFFAGGDRSIRGYKYRSLSPQDSNGKLIGAAKMATASLESQYNISDKWWSALFIDSGEAVNNIKKSNLKVGTGIGIRWQSPIGPIKLDIAYPVSNHYKHNIQFYIGLGPEL